MVTWHEAANQKASVFFRQEKFLHRIGFRLLECSDWLIVVPWLFAGGQLPVRARRKSGKTFRLHRQRRDVQRRDRPVAGRSKDVLIQILPLCRRAWKWLHHCHWWASFLLPQLLCRTLYNLGRRRQFWQNIISPLLIDYYVLPGSQLTTCGRCHKALCDEI